MLRKALCIVGIGLGAATAAHAEVVNVTVTGPVDFNVIGGSMTGVQSGAPVSMSFNLDSNVFTNSPNFPTRGYPIDLNSFNMTVDGRPVPIVNPQSSGDPVYFVLRNNDPAVDGFFMSQGNVDNPFPATEVTIPGLAPVHELDFNVSYDNGNVLSSLNILDAVGSYDQTGLGSYNWGIGRFGNHGAEYVYTTMVISVVPEPATLALPAIALLALARRRRR